MRRAVIDLTGQRFGRLLVIERAPNQGRKTRWLCLCDCGAYTQVQSFNLINGLTRSCGCYRRDRASQVHRKN